MFILTLALGRLVWLNKSGSVLYRKIGGKVFPGLRFPPVRDRRSENGCLFIPGLALKDFAAKK